jgi:hypothetical protein
MKKVLIGLAVLVGGVAILGGAIIGLVFWLSGGAVEASDEFLALIGQEKIEEAYQSTATAFRSQQDAATFSATVRGIGLTRYQSASWTNRQISREIVNRARRTMRKASSTQSTLNTDSSKRQTPTGL